MHVTYITVNYINLKIKLYCDLFALSQLDLRPSKELIFSCRQNLEETNIHKDWT